MRARRPSIDPHHLEADLERLGGALWSAVGAVAGDATLGLVRGLADDAVALREGRLAGGRRALADKIGALDDAQLEEVARALTQWCHLMNVAEEQQRIRVLRSRSEAPDGIDAAVAAMAAAGI